MSNGSFTKITNIQSLIYTVRGKQVMLDRDLADLYDVETKVLNQAVKRNAARFPAEFMYQLTKTELENWKSQIVTSNREKMGLRKLPFAFTEQGVAMLSAVLNSITAITVSIQIMNAFVNMRQFLFENSHVLQRVGTLEQKQIETDTKFNQIFNALEEREITPKKGVFFEGQVFDAHILVSKIIRSAKKSLVLIDNYIDESILTLFLKRKGEVTVTLYTRCISRQLKLDIEKFNRQYSPINVKEIQNVHDRFLIVDNAMVYHIGASLKDLGKKWFAFSKIGKEGLKIVERLK